MRLTADRIQQLSGGLSTERLDVMNVGRLFCINFALGRDRKPDGTKSASYALLQIDDDECVETDEARIRKMHAETTELTETECIRE